MELNDDDKQRVKHLFNNWLELKDSKKSLTAEQKDLVTEASDILESKKGLVSKLFSFLEKKLENGEDELDELSEIASLID